VPLFQPYLRADLAFLRCLERSRQTPARDGIAAAAIYRAMCILGKGGEREWDWRFGADEQMRERGG
jgi:hypothetical protein